MDDPDITIEEYVQLETERALRNSKRYNWETATYGFSFEPTVSPQHDDEINLKDETSLLEYNDEEYNVISFNDLFPFSIYSINDSKLHTDMDDNDKIDAKQFSGDLSIEPLPHLISIDIGLNTANLTEFKTQFGRLLIFWNSMCADRARIQMPSRIHTFAHKRNMEDHT
ncbi:hypothetical protein Tco_1237584 [Tanacetum coccineum]